MSMDFGILVQSTCLTDGPDWGVWV